MNNEYIEFLGVNTKIIVSDIHKFNTDTILLADFANPKKHEIAIELGTGCGAIPLIWSRNNLPKHMTAVDIQEDACDLISRSVKLNNLEEKITVIHSDMRELHKYNLKGKYDVVVCNPPYKQEGTGIVNEVSGKIIARHEQNINLEEICKTAKSLLRFGGRFCLCQRSERLTDVLVAFRSVGLEPKRFRLVQQRKSKASKLFLIEGKSGGKPNGLVMMPTLFIEDENGNFSEEMINIYGEYRKIMENKE